MAKLLTIDEVKNNLNLKHNNLYDYSAIIEYTGKYCKIPIICSKHGLFEQEYRVHLRGSGCTKCGNDTKRVTRTEEERLNKQNNYTKEYRNKKRIEKGIVKKEKLGRNKENEYLYNVAYYKKNKDKILKRFVANRKKRIDDDPLYKLQLNLRRRIYVSIKSNGFTKRHKTFDILGCTFEFFREFISNKFTTGMSWENYGDWHLDHIKPVSLANTEDEIHKLNHYLNFQPLWAIDNIKKGATY